MRVLQCENRLLCVASCSNNKCLREAGATALLNLCSEASVIDQVVSEEGLLSLNAMSQSPEPEVQKLAARSFWHLATHHEDKRKIVKLGGLQSLLKLSKLSERNVQVNSPQRLSFPRGEKCK